MTEGFSVFSWCIAAAIIEPALLLLQARMVRVFFLPIAPRLNLLV